MKKKLRIQSLFLAKNKSLGILIQINWFPLTAKQVRPRKIYQAVRVFLTMGRTIWPDMNEFLKIRVYFTGFKKIKIDKHHSSPAAFSNVFTEDEYDCVDPLGQLSAAWLSSMKVQFILESWTIWQFDQTEIQS